MSKINLPILGLTVIALGCGASPSTDSHPETPETAVTAEPAAALASPPNESPDDDPLDYTPVDAPPYEKPKRSPASAVAYDLKNWPGTSEGPAPTSDGVPTVRPWQGPSHSPGVNPLVVRRVVRRHTVAFRRCYQAVAESGSQVRVQRIEFEIGPDGTTTSAKVHGEPAELRACLEKHLETMTFPKPDLPGTVTRISYPIAEDPAD